MVKETNTNKWERICGDGDIGRTEVMDVPGGKLYRTFGNYEDPSYGGLSMVFVPTIYHMVNETIKTAGDPEYVPKDQLASMIKQLIETGKLKT